MPNTASTNTVVDHTSDAGFRTWTAEIIAQFLGVGLTQTTDTGQINTGTATRPATSTFSQYVIFKFNDTLQATAPIFIKLEFGTTSTATTPSMIITIATGSNGAGTLTGVIGTRVIINGNGYTNNSAIPYLTRFVYNPTLGFCGMSWKIGNSGAGLAYAGFYIFRSNDNTGAATGDAVMLLTNSNNTSSSNTNGYMQALSYLTSSVYGPSKDWGMMVMGLTSTAYASGVQVTIIFEMTPVIQVTAFMCLALLIDIPLHSTFSLAIVGSSPLTFLQVGLSAIGNITSLGALGQSAIGLCVLWQ